MNAPTAVFAYGTLRPGEGLNYMLHRYDPSHAAGTITGWNLHGADHPYPMVLPSTDPTDVVHGDVLNFAARDWPEVAALLDRIEGVPVLYERTLVTVSLSGGGDVTAWLYVPTDRVRAARLAPIVSGDWVEHQSTNPQETYR